jgi:hypothetical protein
MFNQYLDSPLYKLAELRSIRHLNVALKQVYMTPNTVLCRGEIFRIENPSVWQIPMFSQIFPMRNMGRLCAKRLLKK